MVFTECLDGRVNLVGMFRRVGMQNGRNGTWRMVWYDGLKQSLRKCTSTEQCKICNRPTSNFYVCFSPRFLVPLTRFRRIGFSFQNRLYCSLQESLIIEDIGRNEGVLLQAGKGIDPAISPPERAVQNIGRSSVLARYPKEN